MSLNGSSNNNQSNASGAIQEAISSNPTIPNVVPLNTNSIPVQYAGTDNISAKLMAGGLSCMLISLILNPMDVIKVRLQTQDQLTSNTTSTSNKLYSPNSKYTGFYQCGLTIYREEGYSRGLMKGITASMLRESSYSSIRMGLYDYIKSYLAPINTTKDEFKLWQKITAGMGSGALGAVIATPTDLIKIRFQSYNNYQNINPNPYKTTFHAFYEISKQGGIAALYKGATPTIIRAAILTSSQLSSYDQSKRWLLRSGYFSDNPTTHLVASIISGLVTTTCCNPADVIKTRIMTDGASVKTGGKKLYSNPLDCLYKTVKYEGVKSLMKGWLPNYMRLGPHFIVSLPLAEYIRIKLGADTF